jgi:hypothetical protein
VKTMLFYTVVCICFLAIGTFVLITKNLHRRKLVAIIMVPILLVLMTMTAIPSLLDWAWQPMIGIGLGTVFWKIS